MKCLYTLINYINYVLKKCVLLAISFILVFYNSSESQINEEITLDSCNYANKKDSLLALACKKRIDRDFELPILAALSYFPELKNTKIVFKKSRIKTTMNSRPSVFSLLFNKKSSRKYIIRINKSKKDSIITLNEVPFNAKIGIIGHELCHCIDYSKRNFFGVMGRLFDYANKANKAKFEREIDQMTISRGLAWHLHAWARYVLYKSDATEKYKAFKKSIYMQPEEIKASLIN